MALHPADDGYRGGRPRSGARSWAFHTEKDNFSGWDPLGRGAATPSHASTHSSRMGIRTQRGLGSVSTLMTRYPSSDGGLCIVSTSRAARHMSVRKARWAGWICRHQGGDESCLLPAAGSGRAVARAENSGPGAPLPLAAVRYEPVVTQRLCSASR
jgi:hypothetical protein